MSSKDIYLKKFYELLEIEKKARDFYKYYMDNVNDSVLSEQFESIYKDEERHTDIVSNIIKAFDK